MVAAINPVSGVVIRETRGKAMRVVPKWKKILRRR